MVKNRLNRACVQQPVDWMAAGTSNLEHACQPWKAFSMKRAFDLALCNDPIPRICAAIYASAKAEKEISRIKQSLMLPGRCVLSIYERNPATDVNTKFADTDRRTCDRLIAVGWIAYMTHGTIINSIAQEYASATPFAP